MLQVKKLTSFDDLNGFDFSSVGFFQTPEYLQIVIKHFCKEEDVILLGVYDEEKLIGYGCFEAIKGQTQWSAPTTKNTNLDVGVDPRVDPPVIKFLGMKKVLGNQEVTDYGEIVLPRIHEGTKTRIQGEEILEKILEWFRENGFKKVELDYTKKFQVPISNFQTETVEQEVAPNIQLPESWEKYVENLEYKNRRELRRKMNRLENEKTGKYLFSCVDTSIQTTEELKKYFDEFVGLVKLSESVKEKFMTQAMEEFFWDLVTINRGRDAQSRVSTTWTPCLNFLQIDGRNSATILTFENGVESLAYNSGYNPEFIYFSPGFLSHAFKIKELIGRGFKKYDFLRGNERYKYDLGAKEKKLYRISVTVAQ